MLLLLKMTLFAVAELFAAFESAVAELTTAVLLTVYGLDGARTSSVTGATPPLLICPGCR